MNKNYERKLKPYNSNLVRAGKIAGTKPRKKYYSPFRNMYGYGLSMKEIGKILNVSTTLVKKWHEDGSLKERLKKQ